MPSPCPKLPPPSSAQTFVIAQLNGAALLGFVALCGPLVLAACWLAPPRAAHATH
jgi:hypothetical protein